MNLGNITEKTFLKLLSRLSRGLLVISTFFALTSHADELVYLSCSAQPSLNGLYLANNYDLNAEGNIRLQGAYVTTEFRGLGVGTFTQHRTKKRPFCQRQGVQVQTTPQNTVLCPGGLVTSDLSQASFIGEKFATASEAREFTRAIKKALVEKGYGDLNFCEGFEDLGDSRALSSLNSEAEDDEPTLVW